jgi:hypothetical protein
MAGPNPRGEGVFAISRVANTPIKMVSAIDSTLPAR